MATWQFAGDHGQFNNFDPATAGALEQCWAANNGKGKAKLFLKGWTYEYDFDHMTQKNTSTQKVRGLKRIAPVNEEDAAKTKGATGKKPRLNNDDASDDDEAGVTKSHKAEDDGKKSANDKTAAKKSENAATNKSSSSSKHVGSSIGKVVIKGKGAVDFHSGKQNTCHVLEEGNIVYQATLNQTNLSTNNNKFYIIQVLESDDNKEFFSWNRWGRLGDIGQNSLVKCADKAAAIKAFAKKFNDKTGNNWATCATDSTKFVKRDGLYQLMQIDLGNSTEEKLDAAATALENAAAAADVKNKANVVAPQAAPSKLHPSVQDLLKTLGNKETITRHMKELKIDTNKMPLGMISKDQIKKAGDQLTIIEQELKKPNPSSDVLNNASSAFYTLIPHDFGRKKPQLIDSEELVQQKIDQLDLLSGAEIAAKLLDKAEDEKTSVDGEGAALPKKNSLDRAYETLETDMRTLDKNSDEFKRLEKYVQQTHAPTHNMYKLKVVEIFAISRKGEAERYKPFENEKNRQLLWHGSRLTNWMGILSQGLRIRPPGAPVTGSMFGSSALYFANSSSKSANYCFTTSDHTTGLMGLCEVALGNIKEVKKADPYITLNSLKPGNYQSVLGLGRNAPDDSSAEFEENGVKIPLGKIKPSGVNDTVLLYDEFCIYDVAQYKFRYLLKLEFDYKQKCGTFH